MFLLGLAASALVTPTHVLGDTAVYGRAYLWGESSSRVNCGTTICWFVDGLEPAQHALTAAVLVTTTASLVRRVPTWAPFGAMLVSIALAAVRSIRGDGVALTYFWLCLFATLGAAVCDLALAMNPRALAQASLRSSTR